VHSIFTVYYFCLQQNYECWEWHPCFWNNAEMIGGFKAISNIGGEKSVGPSGVHLSILWDFWPIEQLLLHNACGYNQEEWCCSNDLDLYLGGAQFESWPGHWLSCVLWCFSVSQRKYWNSTLIRPLLVPSKSWSIYLKITLPCNARDSDILPIL